MFGSPVNLESVRKCCAIETGSVHGLSACMPFLLDGAEPSFYTAVMNRLLALVCAAPLLAAPLFANEAALQKALAKWDLQLKEWEAAVEQAATPVEKERIQAEKPDGTELAQELWKAVGYRSMRETWACPAIVWWLNHPHALTQVVPPAELPEVFSHFWKAIDAVHYQDPRIAGACEALSRSNDVRVYRMLAKIYAANPDDRARGCAAMALALYLNRPNAFSEAEWGGKDMMRAKRLFYVREALLKAPGAPFGDGTVDEAASEEVYRLRNLSEGSIPPIITVLDMNGKSVRLPMRDKPTVLFFCTPNDEASMSMLSRAAVFETQYPEFAFCPVISSMSRQEAAAALAEQGADCKFFLDPRGEAAQAWRMKEWPRVALISQRCRLLYYGVPNLDFQTLLDACKAEQERDALSLQEGSSSNSPAEPPRSKPSPAPAVEPADAGPLPGTDSQPPDLRPMPSF